MGRNWDWSYQRGRDKRLEQERLAYQAGISPSRKPPLHSHDATLQSYFERGWRSVSQADIHIHLGVVRKPTSTQPLDKLREVKACHFHSSQQPH